jgi:uncharacterized protein (DUF433 family)
MNPLLSRISVDPNVCFGKPCVRGTRIWVSLLLDFLASGMTTEQILEEYPHLTRDDILAAIAYGAEMSRGRFVDLPGRAGAARTHVERHSARETAAPRAGGPAAPAKRKLCKPSSRDVDPSQCAVVAAPVDDEPLTAEEELALREAREWLRHNKPIPHEQVLAELGSTSGRDREPEPA